MVEFGGGQQTRSANPQLLPKLAIPTQPISLVICLCELFVFNDQELDCMIGFYGTDHLKLAEAVNKTHCTG